MKYTESDIDTKNLPKHIAIIMDGNGRWAKGRGKIRIFGHTQGVSTVKEITEACARLGVGYLTLYVFSTENWSRPKIEVNALMELLVKTIRKEAPTLMKNNIRLRTIGNIATLPGNCEKALEETMEITKANTGLNMILALSYSSRWDMTRAIRQLAEDAQQGVLKPSEINESKISSYLSTREFPDPELLIRTSGEYRISNFLLWELAYTELYFTDKLWPEFTEADLFKAIVDYQKRERRFGKTSEQITTENA